MSGSMGSERGSGRGAAYWLWEQSEDVERQIDRLTREIESLERDIVQARAKRDDLRLVVVEMRAAQNLIVSAGLRVERVGDAVTVSLDNPPVTPNNTGSGEVMG